MSLWRSVDVWTVGVTFTFRRVTSEPLCFFPEKLNSVPSLQLHHLPPSGRSNGWKQTCMQMNSWCWQRRLVSPKLMSQGIVEKKKRPGERVGNQSAGRSFTYSLHPTLMLRRWTGNDRSSRVSAACDNHRRLWARLSVNRRHVRLLWSIALFQGEGVLRVENMQVMMHLMVFSAGIFKVVLFRSCTAS